MKLEKAVITALFGVLSLSVAAKPLKKKYGHTENGKVPGQLLNDMHNDVMTAQSNMTQKHYEEVISNPQTARNDQERLAGLSAREVFILIDRSGSMSSGDNNPSGVRSRNWTRWNSAELAAESIAEVALALDSDANVEIMLWDGNSSGQLNAVYKDAKSVKDIQDLFQSHKPAGTTPLAFALEDIYQKRLKSLLQKSEPFTCIILTDGQPNEPIHVKKFFKKVEQENNLNRSGRETLAAFSFVQMGDDRRAEQFLQDLDDNLISQLDMQVDIVDTKKDNFLFGTDEFRGREGVGPFALFWDALYD